jgi:glycosyltransferase involved in cell wall biosynthesis/CelD/BcsL family acetyltransferase involved in cellulose biosynthesis
MKIFLASLHHVEYALELAMALSQRHVIHLLLSQQRVEQTVGNKKINEILSDNNIRCTIIKKYPGKSFRVIKNIVDLYILILRIKPDIIHIQESGDIQYIALFLFRIPIIVTVHDVLPHFGTKFKYNVLLRFIRKYMYKNVIVHGEKLKQKYIELFFQSLGNIYSIPHGSLFSFNSVDKEIKEEKKTILFFGRMEKYKGLKFLIEASYLVEKIIPDLKVIIAGAGEDLKKRKKDITEKSIFEVHDEFIPNDKISDLFKRATLVVLPYIEASQSGVVAMAYAFKKPVIATNVGSIPEMVINGKTGLIVPPENPQALKDAIVYLLSHSDVRNEFKKDISIATQSKFNWDSISLYTEKVYQGLIYNKWNSKVSLNKTKNFKNEESLSVDTSVIKNEMEFRKIKKIWTYLVEKDDEATPFQTYSWNKAWWDTYGKKKQLFIVLLHRSSKPLALFPFMIVNEKFLNFTIKRVQFIGTGESDYLVPILNLKPKSAWFYAITCLFKNNKNWHLIELQRIPFTSKAFYGLKKFFSESNSFQITRKDKHCQACPIVKIDGEWNDFILKEKSKKTIKKINHKYSLLSKCGTISFMFIREREAIENILKKIAEVEHKSWKKNSETALFLSSKDHEFMLKVCSEFAEKGKLRILGILLDNRLITYRIGYLFKNKFYSYSTSYDPDYKKFSPGILLLKDTIQSCFMNKVSEYDHGRGEEKFKMEWSNSMNKFNRTLIFNKRIDSLLLYMVEKYLYIIAVILKDKLFKSKQFQIFFPEKFKKI